MKHLFTIILLLTICCYSNAQDFGDIILRNSPFKNTFNSGKVEQAIYDLSNVWKADEKGVSFVITVENLPLSAVEILNYSKEFLNEAYKLSKYRIDAYNEERCYVIGKGEFNNFESYAAFPNQYSFSCEHDIRIDAKEGRARLCINVSEYHGLRINGNKSEKFNVKVKDVSPINKEADSRKMYNKVFLALAKNAIATLYEMKEMLQSKHGADIGDWQSPLIYDLYNKDGIRIRTFDKKYLVSFMNMNDKKAEHLIIMNYQKQIRAVTYSE